jgi:hypothetical protein
MFRSMLAAAGVLVGLALAPAASAQSAREYVNDRFAEGLMQAQHNAVIEGATSQGAASTPFMVANPGNASALIVACESRCSSVAARIRAAGMPELRARNSDRQPHLLILEIPRTYTRSLSNFEISLDLGCRLEAGCLHRWALVSRGLAMPLSQRGVRTMPTPAELAQATQASNLDWVQRPDGEALRFFYPVRAWRNNISGSARLDCLIAAGGVLRCRARSEAPAQEGFGDAALKLATMLRVAERNEAGETLVGQRVSVPIQFQPGA